MTKNKIKEIVFNYIKEHRGTSFVNLERLFEKVGYDYKGDFGFNFSKFPNIVFWTGWNTEAIEIIQELMGEELIAMDSCSIIVYMIDGKLLGYPIAKQLRNYKSLHWAPITFSLYRGGRKCN